MNNRKITNIKVKIVDIKIPFDIDFGNLDKKLQYLQTNDQSNLIAELKRIGAKNVLVQDDIELNSTDQNLLICIAEIIIQMAIKWREVESISGLLNFHFPFHLKSIDHDFFSNISEFPNKRWKYYFKNVIDFQLKKGLKSDIFDFYMDVFKKYHLFNNIKNLELIEMIRNFSVAL